MARVGRQGVVTMEESKTAEDNLIFVEGMQFDRGYYSPYFVTDPERMVRDARLELGRGDDGVGACWVRSMEIHALDPAGPGPAGPGGAARILAFAEGGKGFLHQRDGNSERGRAIYARLLAHLRQLFYPVACRHFCRSPAMLPLLPADPFAAPPP